MRLIPSSLLAALTLTLPAVSASAATIDFTGIAGANGSVFSFAHPYSEDGFTVTSGRENQYHISDTIGDAQPSLYVSPFAIAATLLVTETSGGDFNFTGVYLADAGIISPEAFTVSGFLNGSLVFTETGTVPTAGSKLAFADYATTFGSDKVDEVTISLTGLSTTYVDDIGVSPAATPEPSSLVLLGTGLVGLAGAARRRLGR